MDGLMMDRPLLVSSLIEHAATYHGDTEIVSRTVEGPIHRTTYAEAERRAKRVANALTRLGIRPGDRVATLAWNGYRHFELYFGISGIGAVCHTINPRLFHEQIEYIVNHAEDRVLFVDLTFVPLVEKLADKLKPIRHIVIMTDAAHMPQTALPDALCYETLIAAETDALAWPEFDERRACSMCYTSGTTGNPKAALYSHRSTILHTFAVCSADAIGFSSLDTICPIVPMFHANAWGVPYAATMVGAKLVFPGPALDGPSLCALFEAEGVTPDARRPDGVARHAEGDGGARQEAAAARAPPRRRLGRAPRHDRDLRDEIRRHGHAWLGHDRDEPGRHRRHDEGQASRSADRGEDRHQGHAGPADVRRRDEDRRRRGPPPAA